jgi:hypothetical protein
MSKSFSHAGVSRLKGEFKVRYCNDALRVKVLAKNGHTDIDIIQMKEPMSKEDTIAYLMSIDFATRDGVTNAEVQAALEAEVDKRTDALAKEPKVKETKTPAVKKAAVKKGPSMDAIKAKVDAAKKAPVGTKTKAQITAELAGLEDAPF